MSHIVAESPRPLLALGAVHFKHVTDLAWSPDGKYLVASSHDGYCTVAAFQPGELGTPLADESVGAEALRARVAAQRASKVLTPLCYAAVLLYVLCCDGLLLSCRSSSAVKPSKLPLVYACTAYI